MVIAAIAAISAMPYCFRLPPIMRHAFFLIDAPALYFAVIAPFRLHMLEIIFDFHAVDCILFCHLRQRALFTLRACLIYCSHSSFPLSSHVCDDATRLFYALFSSFYYAIVATPLFMPPRCAMPAAFRCAAFALLLPAPDCRSHRHAMLTPPRV